MLHSGSALLTTAVSVLTAIGLLLPGFIVVELANARGARASRSDLELALRALAYTLVLHAIASPWTVWLVKQLDSPDAWHPHTGAIVAYVVVVLVVSPILIGLILNLVLAATEPPRGVWIAASQIARLEIVPEAPDTLE